MNITLLPEKKIILWDIDGTILTLRSKNLESTHLKALHRQGISPKGTVKEQSGLTDFEVLEGLLGNVETQELLLKNAFNELDNIFLANSHLRSLSLCKGVTEALNLSIQLGWINGVLTGNTHKRTIRKLQESGIIQLFNHNFIFSCEYKDTRVMITERAEQILKNYNFKKIIIIGDSLMDIKISKIFNLPIISVSTGLFSSEELDKYQPELVLQDFQKDINIFNNFLINI